MKSSARSAGMTGSEPVSSLASPFAFASATRGEGGATDFSASPGSGSFAGFFRLRFPNNLRGLLVERVAESREGGPGQGRVRE